MPIPTALRAQAIAARSYGWWQYEFNKPMNNSNSFQVFVPYRFDKLNLTAAPMEPEILTPCDPYRFRNEPQEMECDAIAPQYYLSSMADDLPALSEFSADTVASTNASSDPRFPYLASVEDPISTSCDASNDGHRRGMSQWGAARWARGDQCALKANGPEPWSIVWDRAEQILFHYYTRVHLRDADNDNKIISPDWRWNPLKIEWGTQSEIGGPPVLIAGQTRAVPIQIQNTSIDDWNCRIGDTPLSYRLRYRWLNGSTVIYTASTGLYMCNVLAGGAKNDLLQVYAPAGLSGTYTLRLDMYESFGNFWFSDGGWPPYDVTVRIIPPPSPTPTATPCGNDC
jgi:hypothetical protein